MIIHGGGRDRSQEEVIGSLDLVCLNGLGIVLIITGLRILIRKCYLILYKPFLRHSMRHDSALMTWFLIAL